MESATFSKTKTSLITMLHIRVNERFLKKGIYTAINILKF